MTTFTVYGVPQPKGSTRAFLPKNGRFPIITDNNKNLKPWSQDVARTALQYRPKGEVYTGPVSLSLEFMLLKPKALAKKPDSLPTKKPDLDKLARGILDSLTGIFYIDDAQVVDCHIRKSYAYAAPGVTVTVRQGVGE